MCGQSTRRARAVPKSHHRVPASLAAAASFFPNEWAMQLIAKDREAKREAQLAELERHREERAREAREESFRLEQARAAERAAAAAERQVVTAERANRIAIAALIFVGASFLLSLGALFKRRR